MPGWKVGVDFGEDIGVGGERAIVGHRQVSGLVEGDLECLANGLVWDGCCRSRLVVAFHFGCPFAEE